MSYKSKAAKREIIPLGSGEFADAINGVLVVGSVSFDPDDWPEHSNFRLEVTFSVTDPGINGSIRLFNLDDRETVVGTLLTTNSVIPVKRESLNLIVGSAPGNLKDSRKVYEARLSVTGTLDTDIVHLGSVFLVVD